MTRNRREDSAVHMMRKTTVLAAGEAVIVPLCLAHGWDMTSDWNRVTCKRCLRQQPLGKRKNP